MTDRWRLRTPNVVITIRFVLHGTHMFIKSAATNVKKQALMI